MIFAIITISTALYGAVHQGVLALVYSTIALMLLCWSIDSLRNGTLRVSDDPLQIMLFAAAAYGLIQVLPLGTLPDGWPISDIPNTISLDPFTTKVNALHFLGLGLFFSLAIVSIDSASRLRKLAVFITAFGALFAFFAILQSVLSPTKIYGLLERPLPFGSFVSRNNFAGWMEMAIAIPLGMLFTGSVSQDKRLIYITAVVLMGVSIMLSGSRGGLIALVLQLGFLVLVTYLNRERSSTGLRLALGIGILAAIIAGTAFIGGENTLTRISDGQGVAEGVVTRPQIWTTTLKMIGANQPFGVGLGAFGVAYTKYDEASGFERVEQAHNDYLQVLSDAGIVGAILGFAFLFLVFRAGFSAVKVRNLERRGIAAGAFVGVFGAFVHSIFDFNLHTTAIALLFLLLLAVLVASRSNYEDDAVEGKHRRRKREATAQQTGQ
ncbi:MAG TPA: O-antigen ligase family protein [Pyrinomonadaceae bacterium]|nr:O-antigen ligase family protein [Pyrinomonadaceae bacterium]